jgi:hypothetical protein
MGNDLDQRSSFSLVPPSVIQHSLFSIQHFPVIRRYRVIGVPGRPELYLRVFHGGNTWDIAHHRRQAGGAEAAADLAARREQIERDALAFGLSRVTVMGRDRAAFEIDDQVPWRCQP